MTNAVSVRELDVVSIIRKSLTLGNRCFQRLPFLASPPPGGAGDGVEIMAKRCFSYLSIVYHERV